MANSTERFSDCVENYAKHRPGYPDAVVDLLESAGVLRPDAVIADIGCGTGLSSLPFLRRGYSVVGVEPNASMREAAAGIHAFTVVDGSAEVTTLPGGSVDLVIAGQAFHWFDLAVARREFNRILKPDGRVVLLWNTRRLDSPFAQDYEQLLREFGTDYGRVRHENLGEATFAEFFPHGFEKHSLPNEQVFDFEGLSGRLLSSSFVPTGGDPRHQPMLDALARLFSKHAVDGTIRFAYSTDVYCGR